MTDAQSRSRLSDTVNENNLHSGHDAIPEAPDKDALVSRLDVLLERYLSTLDLYQQSQQKLTAHLSSGYLSLAQANFNNQRTRYGPDYYDQRMQTSRRINVEAENEDVAFSLSAPASSIRPESRPPTDTSVDGGGDESATSFEETNVNSASTAKGDLPKDPLRWFGILVPPALRQAQSAFASAVEGPIPEIATLAKDLRRQEVDIARLRKLIKKM